MSEWEVQKWFVPCDYCHKHWVTVQCETKTVFDEIESHGVRARFPRKVVRYDKVKCNECKEKKGRPEI